MTTAALEKLAECGNSNTQNTGINSPRKAAAGALWVLNGKQQKRSTPDGMYMTITYNTGWAKKRTIF